MYSNADRRPRAAAPIFEGLAQASDRQVLAGLVWARGDNQRTLYVAAATLDGSTLGAGASYELDGSMRLTRLEDPTTHDRVIEPMAIPQGVISVDAASAIYIDEAGRRWRLPRGDATFDELSGRGLLRIDREVVTERDLFHCHGTFYELPAENAGGFARIRPISTHNRKITDYCSYRGLLVMTGVCGGESNRHIIRSEDAQAAVWVGAVDDLWQLGKAVGRGGPWKDSAVKANVASDPYLMTGYDRKRLTLSHDRSQGISIRVEVDITGMGDWMPYHTFDVCGGATVTHDFPASFAAYWVRVVADRDCTATAWLDYE